MAEDIYNRGVLDLVAGISRIGRLADPDGSATEVSRLCGSAITVDLKVDGDVVTDFAQEVHASALGQAAASVMARNVIGASADELRSVRETVRRMLKENGPPPGGRFGELAILESARAYPQLHASTMLAFDAIVGALNQIEARRATQPAA